MGNIVRRLKKDQEVTWSNGGPGGCQVGPAGLTLAPVGAPYRVSAPSYASFLHRL